VRAAALTQYKLLGGTSTFGNFFTLPSHPELAGEKSPTAHRLDVGETFFTTMGIPLRLGRGLDAAMPLARPRSSSSTTRLSANTSRTKIRSAKP